MKIHRATRTAFAAAILAIGIACPVAASHTRAVEGELSVTTFVPSELKLGNHQSGL